MAAATQTGSSGDVGALQRAADYLGGERVLKRVVGTVLDAHEMILDGMPARAVTHLVGELGELGGRCSLEKALGMSLRTMQRKQEPRAKPLSVEQGGRAWKLAEILARATSVFGGRAEAELWLGQAAIGLDQRRPIDLMATPAGTELVEDHLTRLEFGVYA